LRFKVSARGLRILNFEPVFQGKCTKPGSSATQSPLISTDAGRNIPITKGKFYAHATNGTLHAGSKTVGTARDQVHGKFKSRRRAAGTYTVTFTFNSSAPDGLAGFICKTGVVRWTAVAG
jgi:hypothetical protein